MDGRDDIRFTQHQQVIVPFQVARPVGETLAAKIVFTQTIALDHGAHAAVQHQNSFI
ncbi:hypothetical protein D3C72_1395510 [compost metagenome]